MRFVVFEELKPGLFDDSHLIHHNRYCLCDFPE